jgi:hypothetical protein
MHAVNATCSGNNSAWNSYPKYMGCMVNIPSCTASSCHYCLCLKVNTTSPFRNFDTTYNLLTEVLRREKSSRRSFYL